MHRSGSWVVAAWLRRRREVIAWLLLFATCVVCVFTFVKVQSTERNLQMLISDSMDARLTQMVSAKITGLPALGAGSTISIDGNDAIGQINIETGANPTPGDMFHVTFAKAYSETDVQPFVFIQPIDQPAIVGFHCTIDWWGFDCIADAGLKSNTNYPLAYFVVSRPWAMYLTAPRVTPNQPRS